MVRRRAKAADITTEVCNHTFRGTGITAYLENGGTLEKARQMAAHASTRTTQLYDRREDRVTLDEVVKVNTWGSSSQQQHGPSRAWLASHGRAIRQLVTIDGMPIQMGRQGTGKMSNLMDEGLGSFVFSDDAAGTRRSIRVFFFRPRSCVRDTRIVIAMHGFDRAASDFRDVLVDQAERCWLIVLVPEFDAEAFPDAYAYNYGNVRLSPPSATVLPRDLWNFGIIDRLFQHVMTTIDSDRKTFGLFGLSAGAQYVFRYLALTDASAVDMAVAANCGWYMLPDLTVEYPAGMAGLDLDVSYLRRYLGRHLIVLLGDADNDSAAQDLPRSEAAMAQGPNRLARGLWHFEHCKQVAEQLGVSFNWKLEIVPGAGHVGQQVYDRAANILNIRRI
jgi:hypothetical protein